MSTKLTSFQKRLIANLTVLGLILTMLALFVLALFFGNVQLDDHSPRLAKLNRAEADHFFNCPFAAIKESLANAVYHRGYDLNEPIRVRIAKDRIEILSFPGPDRSVTQEDLNNFHITAPRYRNRLIGDFLKELRLTEGRNTGIPRIISALKKNGSPMPEFITDEEHSFFLTRIFIREGF